MKTIIIGLINGDGVLSPGQDGIEVETCYRDGSPIYRAILKDELLEHEGKRVMITIEDING